MAILTDLESVRDNLMAKLKEYSVSPKPSYTIEGQTVNGSDYLKQLIDGIKAVNELMVIFDPYELRTLAR